MRNSILLLLVVCLVGGCAACEAQTPGQPYSATVIGIPVSSQANAKLVSAGSMSWTYLLINDSPMPNYSIWLLSIEVDQGITVDDKSVASPDGWVADTTDPSVISWISVASDLVAGESLDGFGVTFSGAPVQQAWSVQFNNTENVGEMRMAFGEVTTVAAVPEPASVAAVATGVIGLFGVFRKRNRGV